MMTFPFCGEFPFLRFDPAICSRWWQLRGGALGQTDRCGRRLLEAGDYRGQDRSRHADQFGYVGATVIRHPEVARAVDRHGRWCIEVRPGRGKVAEQGPVAVKRGYGIALGVRHPDVARAVDCHEL